MKKHRHRWGPLRMDRYDPKRLMIWRQCACGLWRCDDPAFVAMFRDLAWKLVRGPFGYVVPGDPVRPRGRSR